MERTDIADAKRGVVRNADFAIRFTAACYILEPHHLQVLLIIRS